MGKKSYFYHNPNDGSGEKSSNEGCCSKSCLRFSTHLFNFLLFLTGLASFGVGLWTLIVKQPSLTSGLYDVIAYSLIIIGLLLLTLSIVGCCGISKKNRRLILIYSISLVVLVLAEAAIGALAYCYRSYISSELRINLFDKFQKDYGVEDSITRAVDQLQERMKCCGVDSFNDWKNTEWWNKTSNRKNNLVPDSCCLTPTTHCGVRDHPSNIYYTGCIERIGKIAGDHLIIIGAVALGVCFVQIFGIILACTLHWKMKKNESYV